MKIIRQRVSAPLDRGEIVRVKPLRFSRTVLCSVATCSDADGGCHNCVLSERPSGCSTYWYYVRSDKGTARYSAKFIPIEEMVE